MHTIRLMARFSQASSILPLSEHFSFILIILCCVPLIDKRKLTTLRINIVLGGRDSAHEEKDTDTLLPFTSVMSQLGSLRDQTHYTLGC